MVNSRDLVSVIIRMPVVVTAGTSVKDTVSEIYNTSFRNQTNQPLSCNQDHILTNLSTPVLHAQVRSSCAIVADGNQVVGLITMQDLVRLIATGVNLETTPVGTVATTPVATLPEAELTTIAGIATVLQQQGVDYGAIVNSEGQVVGIVTQNILQMCLYAAQLAQYGQTSVQQQCRLISLLESLPVGIFRTNAEGNCVYANQRLCQMAGITAEETRGYGWLKTIYPDDRDALLNEWQAAIANQRPFQMEYRLQTATGQVIWVYGHAVPEYHEMNQIVGYVGTIIDISDRKQTELALRQSEATSRAMLAAIPDLMFRVSRDGVYQDIANNRPQIDLLANCDRIGQTLMETLPPEIAHRHLAHIHQALSTGQLQVYEQQVQIGNRLQTEEVRVMKSREDEVLMMIRDISDRKAAEQALKIQRDFNQLIAEITSCFVDVDAAELDPEIQHALQRLGEAIDVDTSYIIRFSPGDRIEAGRTLSMTHQWSRPGYPSQQSLVQNLPLNSLPWANTKILQRDIVCVPDVENLPAIAASDQAVWQQFQVRAVLAVPLVQKSTVVGLMGFASLTYPISWDPQIVRLLRVVAQTIASAQERAEATQQLYLSEERLRLALAATNQGLYDLNLQTGDAIVNADYATMLGYDPATFEETTAKWIERLHPDDRASTVATYQAYIAGEIPTYCVEFRQRTQSGNYIWTLSSGKIVAWDANGQPLRMLGTHVDITERKQAEMDRLQAEQTRRELNLLENILDVILAGYWDWDILHDIPYLSPGFKRMFGYADHELPNVHASWQTLMLPEDLPKVLASFEQHFRSRGASPCYNEVRYRHKDGRVIWVMCVGKVIEWDAGGNPLRMVGCHIDITRRKQAEAELQAAKEELERFFTLALNLFCIADSDGRFLRLNLAWEHTLGYSLAELEGQSFIAFVHPDDVEPTLATIAKLKEQQLVQSFVNRYRCKDGSYRYLEWYACLYDSLVYATARDITEQQQAELQLHRSNAHLRMAQRIGKLGSWEFSVQTGDVYWSEEVFTMFGLDPQDGAPSFERLQQCLHPDDRTIHAQTVQTAIETIQPYTIELRAYRPDGTLVYMQAQGEPIVDADGTLIQLVGTVLDITDRKQAEEQIRRYAAQLEASNRELEAFAYSVSHDLRAPLRAIDGFSKALLEDYGNQISDEGKDYFDRIRKNVSRMGSLIEDLLNLSRVSRVNIRYTTVDLSAMAQSILDELQATSPERAVTCHVAPSLIVTADATLMRVVLTNLLHNAWKFTSHHPTACIEVGSFTRDDRLVYFVRDDGAGFDMAFANMLFGVFQRLHNTTEFPGTGVGLAAVQRAIHRHGGQIWAEAAVEQGATFYFTIPTMSLPPGDQP
ncbi:MAG: PAS domain-containing protein [Cyanobacteria bacterium]|nr:PAS domain-containing protein [Cyanobacteriota bacterium]MDW8199669.1 PAS domain-containing protein [Cyanobacteriota bacterium SKYGB_h_bin112]